MTALAAVYIFCAGALVGLVLGADVRIIPKPRKEGP